MGLVLTLEAPSALSVGLCLAHMVTDKRAWLERVGVQVDWPVSVWEHRAALDRLRAQAALRPRPARPVATANDGRRPHPHWPRS